MFDPDVVKAWYLKEELDWKDKRNARCSYLKQYHKKFHISELGFQYEASYNLMMEH